MFLWAILSTLLWIMFVTKRELTTNIEYTVMRDPILFSTKNIQFTFNKDIYKQTDGVAMGSPLGPALAGIIMAELEKTLVSRLSNH